MGKWYSLTLDPSEVLVSEAVNDVDDQQEKRSITRLCNTMTGLVNGPDDRLDTATDVDVFLARSSDEVHPKHQSPDERLISCGRCCRVESNSGLGFGESCESSGCRHGEKSDQTVR